jgi:hypothetical protein
MFNVSHQLIEALEEIVAVFCVRLAANTELLRPAAVAAAVDVAGPVVGSVAGGIMSELTSALRLIRQQQT